MTCSVFDVAKYILEQKNSTTAMKLQKLCYYSQAWSIVWDSEPMFKEDIQAWANGPVVPELFYKHRGQYSVSSLDEGDTNNLSDSEKETINKVLEFYGGFNSQELSDLTHMESPWKDARKGIPVGARSENIITNASMEEYYSSING